MVFESRVVASILYSDFCTPDSVSRLPYHGIRATAGDGGGRPAETQPETSGDSGKIGEQPQDLVWEDMQNHLRDPGSSGPGKVPMTDIASVPPLEFPESFDGAPLTNEAENIGVLSPTSSLNQAMVGQSVGQIYDIETFGPQVDILPTSMSTAPSAQVEPFYQSDIWRATPNAQAADHSANHIHDDFVDVATDDVTGTGFQEDVDLNDWENWGILNGAQNETVPTSNIGAPLLSNEQPFITPAGLLLTTPDIVTSEGAELTVAEI